MVRIVTVLTLMLFTGPPIVYFAYYKIYAIDNSFNRLLCFAIGFIGLVIIIFACIDYAFRTRITEKIIANLITDLIRWIIKCTINTLMQMYKASHGGIVKGKGIIKRFLRLY